MKGYKETISLAQELNTPELRRLLTKFNRAKANWSAYNKIINRMKNEVSLILKQREKNGK